MAQVAKNYSAYYLAYGFKCPIIDQTVDNMYKLEADVKNEGSLPFLEVGRLTDSFKTNVSQFTRILCSRISTIPIRKVCSACNFEICRY